MSNAFRFCVLWLLVCLSARAEEVASLSQRELGWEAYRIFSRHCADCHGGHRSKPKGKFGHVLDLERLSGDTKFIVPGEPDDSELYLVMTDPDPDFLMPPPDSDALPVAETDLAKVHDWILGGAGLGLADGESESAVAAVVIKPESASPPSLRRIGGRMHPLVVHFPIALLLAALGAELLGLREAARWCLWIGALGAICSAGSGWLFAGSEGYAPATVFRHRWLGVATAVLALISAGALDVAVRRPSSKRPLLLARIALLLTAALVGIAGHTGGVLVHGEGFPW